VPKDPKFVFPKKRFGRAPISAKQRYHRIRQLLLARGAREIVETQFISK